MWKMVDETFRQNFNETNAGDAEENWRGLFRHNDNMSIMWLDGHVDSWSKSQLSSISQILRARGLLAPGRGNLLLPGYTTPFVNPDEQ